MHLRRLHSHDQYPYDSLANVVGRYFDAANGFDAAGAAACFTPEATVHDENLVHVGIAKIERWVSRTSDEYQPRVTVTNVRTNLTFP